MVIWSSTMKSSSVAGLRAAVLRAMSGLLVGERPADDGLAGRDGAGVVVVRLAVAGTGFHDERRGLVGDVVGGVQQRRPGLVIQPEDQGRSLAHDPGAAVQDQDVPVGAIVQVEAHGWSPRLVPAAKRARRPAS